MLLNEEGSQRARQAERQRKTGVLLINVGTPRSPQERDVRAYLKQFLMDPDVLDIPYLLRWIVVHGAILPKRPQASALAYQKIWTDRGSPLLFNLEYLVSALQARLGTSWVVQGAMRYGEPTIAEALQALRSADMSDVIVIPLYPQYSTAATESAWKECQRVNQGLRLGLEMRVILDFYAHPRFIEAIAERVEEDLKSFDADFILFSFHGLPERQIKKLNASGSYCLQGRDCCEKMTAFNTKCYRAQCYETARLVANRLGWSRDRFQVCFQSRLGRTPWIQPFTDVLYRELPKQGKKRLAVICPSFVADCLETLEEVQIRGREEFLKHGGEDLRLVRSLNDSPVWIQAVEELVLGI
jgi:ferrochelatase